MDGWVTIGTKLDSKQLEKDLRDSERQLKQYEKEAEKLTQQKVKIELDVSNYEAAIKLTEEEYDKILKNAQTQEQVNEVLAQEEQELKVINTAYEISKEELDDINKKITENAHNQRLTNEKIVEMNNNINKIHGFENIKGSVDSIGNSIEKVTKKIVKWGLAIFGVRSIISLIKRSVSTLSQYDDQLGANIEYIRFAMANLLKPIIETIIKLAYKLLVYTAYIAKAWFGVNLFANSSAKAFQDTNKAVKSTNKSAKELQKTLTGFDEMNILQENGDTALGGGGGGISVPSIDLSNWEDIPIPGWVKWIADNGETVAKVLLGIAAGLTAIKLGATPLMALGIGIAAIGIYDTIKAILNFIEKPSWENFGKILQGISTILIGLGITLISISSSNPLGWMMLGVGLIGQFHDVILNLIGGLQGLAVVIDVVSIAMIALNASNPIGWIGLAVGVVGTVITAFGNWGKKTNETTKELKDSKQATDELREAQEELANQTNTYTSAVKNAEKTQRELEEAERKNKLSGEELYRAVQLGTIDYKKMNESQREVFDAYVANLEAQDRLTDATNKFKIAQDDANRSSGQLSGAIYQETGQMDSYFKQLLKGYREGTVDTKTFYLTLNSMLSNMDKDSKKTFVNGLPKDVKDGIKTAGSEAAMLPNLWSTQLNLLVQDNKNVFENDIPNQIKGSLDTNQYNNIFSRFKNAWNNTIDSLKKNINVSASTSTSGGGYRAKGGIFYPSRLPKLAVGGIINQPGRGVPYNGAYIGERGAEAVVPLTDSQQMALLGETIGRYITVNAQMNNYMNGRLISRELQKVQSDSDFAYNR